MRRLAGSISIALLAVLALADCSSSDEVDALPGTQKYNFLKSLKLVENADEVLQSKSKTKKETRQALYNMDQGLKLAFQVKNKFLTRLDARLGKNYQRYFVKGVEDYRLGVEAGDTRQKKNGTRLLAKWDDFWADARSAVEAKLDP